jgi:hypothetical protein
VLPNTGALNSTTQSLKEWLGVATYRLRGWL